MKFLKKWLLFVLGGGAYVGLEFLWRGRSHVSMFAAGGVCFLLLGKIEKSGLPLPFKIGLGAVGITAVELATGLIVNRSFEVWDYRGMRFNFLGQICPMYTLLWLPVAWIGMGLYRAAERRLNAIPQGRGTL